MPNFADFLSLGGNEIIGQMSGRPEAEEAARQQLAAQETNLDQQRGLYQVNQNAIANLSGDATGAINTGAAGAGSALQNAYGQQQGLYGQAANAMGQNGAMGSLTSGYGQAGAGLQSGFTQAGSALNSGYGQARQDLSAADTKSALGSNFQQDPGYAFRLQQGQQGMDRAQAAAGGRYSGAALKAAMGYNSGMASQEFGAAAGRDAQLRGMQMQQGQNLAGMSAAQGQNQANLASQYGQNQANLSVQGGQAMAGQYNNLANLYGNQAGAAQTFGQNQANVATGQGNALAGVYGNQMGANLQNSGMMSNAYNQFAQYPGMVNQATANNDGQMFNAGSSIAGMFIGKSDANFKTNIVAESDDVAEMLRALKPYSFEYTDKPAPRMFGVMAQDLEKSRLGTTMVVETDEGKHIDVWRAVSALLGTVAHLQAEIDALKAGK